MEVPQLLFHLECCKVSTIVFYLEPVQSNSHPHSLILQKIMLVLLFLSTHFCVLTVEESFNDLDLISCVCLVPHLHVA
jgi:hypothetical protein